MRRRGVVIRSGLAWVLRDNQGHFFAAVNVGGEHTFDLRITCTVRTAAGPSRPVADKVRMSGARALDDKCWMEIHHCSFVGVRRKGPNLLRSKDCPLPVGRLRDLYGSVPLLPHARKPRPSRSTPVIESKAGAAGALLRCNPRSGRHAAAAGGVGATRRGC